MHNSARYFGAKPCRHSYTVMHSSEVGLCVSITFWHFGDTAQTCPAVNILNATHKGTAHSIDCRFHSKADIGQLNLPHRTFFFKKIQHKPETENIHLFDGPLSGTIQVIQYQKGKTSLDFTEARDSGIS